MRRRMMASIGGGAKKMPTARDYVQDGLLAMWDGIENAGWGSRAESSDSWTELITSKKCGKRSGDDNIEVLDDGFRFVNGGFNTGISLGNIVAIEAVLKIDNEQNSGPLLCSLRAGIQLVLVKNSDGVQYVPLTYTEASHKKAVVTVGEKFAISIAREIGFTNGIDSTVVDNTVSGWGFNYSTGTIAYYQPTNFVDTFTNFVGDIHSLRCYSRKLTYDEITANYAIDKARFGLP